MTATRTPTGVTRVVLAYLSLAGGLVLGFWALRIGFDSAGMEVGSDALTEQLRIRDQGAALAAILFTYSVFAAAKHKAIWFIVEALSLAAAIAAAALTAQLQTSPGTLIVAVSLGCGLILAIRAVATAGTSGTYFWSGR